MTAITYKNIVDGKPTNGNTLLFDETKLKLKDMKKLVPNDAIEVKVTKVS